MSVIPHLSESLIKYHAAPRAFEKGKRALQTVQSLVRRGNCIQAVVGSSVTYQVQIEFDQTGILQARSNYHGDRLAGVDQGWCRYTVAALLACLYQPELIITKQPIPQLLAQLNRDQLQALVENLIKFDPNLTEEIELAAEFLLGTPTPQIKSSAPASPEQTPQAETHPPNSIQLALLQQISQNLFSHSTIQPDIEQIDALESELTEIWLGLNLSDRAALQPQLLKQIQSWQQQIGDQADLSMLQTAIEHGWEYPPLVNALQGNTSALGAWVDQVPPFADRLAQIRLKVLAANNRKQEYLNLAAAEGQVSAYLGALTRLGELEEALKLIPELVTNATEALELAQQLFNQNHLDHAFNLAILGLNLAKDSGKLDLAQWVLEQAGIDQPATFDPSWQPELQELLGRAMDVVTGATPGFHQQYWQYHSQAQFEQAVNLLLNQDLDPDYTGTILDQLFHHLSPTAQAQAITEIGAKATEIMNFGKANAYDQAISWLKHIQKYMDVPEWQKYYQNLLQTYAKKRKLLELLRQLA